jgi:hypothetical protein
LLSVCGLILSCFGRRGKKFVGHVGYHKR